MSDKVINIASWVLLLAVVILLLGFATKKKGVQQCSGIQIEVDHRSGNYFVDEADIHRMVYHEADTFVGQALSKINSNYLERKIDNHPAIEKAEVYKTIDGKLVIDVYQRTPIVRIFSYNGESYYIDSTGKVMPSSLKYTANVLVVNGLIFDNFIDVNRLDMKRIPDSLAASTLVDDIFRMADFIRKDPLWDAQIEQLYVNKDFEFELIPRVGSHRIVFGEATSIKDKFDKLKIFYKKGLDSTGWNEYSTINIKYANQVVCSKQ